MYITRRWVCVTKNSFELTGDQLHLCGRFMAQAANAFRIGLPSPIMDVVGHMRAPHSFRTLPRPSTFNRPAKRTAIVKQAVRT